MEDANQSAEATPVQLESFRQKAPESAGEGICRCTGHSEAQKNAFVVSTSCETRVGSLSEAVRKHYGSFRKPLAILRKPTLGHCSRVAFGPFWCLNHPTE